MQYSDKPFPKDSQLFPKFGTVLDYLSEYSANIRHLIRFQVQVLHVRLSDPRTGTWVVTRKHLPTGLISTGIYDAVVVAIGHYAVPCIPSILGISTWNEAYPHAICHSKLYSSPDRYRHQ